MEEEYMAGMVRKIAEGEYTRDELSAFLNELDELDDQLYVRVINEIYSELANQVPGEIDPLFKAKLESRLDNLPLHAEEVEERDIPVVSMRPGRGWIRWAAAAAILLIGLGAYLFSRKTNEKPTLAVLQLKEEVSPPSVSRATITLANGQKVFLDSAGSGTLAVQGNASVIKKANGQVEYSASARPVPGSSMVYNTLTNPRGSKAVSLTLSDGTSVWLNSESSLTYPATFIGKERNVKITGEAYFEVTKNTAMPFTVTKDELTITVLGTHFNINTYPDEANMKVTLLEGLIKITKKNATDFLKPGQQAQISDDIRVANNVDVDAVMAWKNGKFLFDEKADIATVMRQIARWYNVDVEYKGTISKHFLGSISRNVNASEIFSMLESTGGVHFKIEGRKVTVMP